MVTIKNPSACVLALFRLILYLMEKNVYIGKFFRSILISLSLSLFFSSIFFVKIQFERKKKNFQTQTKMYIYLSKKVNWIISFSFS